jgi:hypothetical protein
MMGTANKKEGSASVCLLFVLAVLLIFSFPADTIRGQEMRVVRVGSPSLSNDTVRIEPRFMMVNPSTVVIWWNKGQEEIKVIFMEGATCDAGTGSPRGFHVESEAENCYITAYFPSGETSSLMFVSEDIYEYEVRIGGKAAEKGRIVVSDKDIYL